MITIRHDICIMCGTCAMVCPVKALKGGEMQMEHFPEKCTDCTLCVSNCPVKAITLHRKVKKSAGFKPETAQ